MLPMTFDRRVLASPTLDYDDSAGKLMKVLRAIVERRVLPSFAEDESVDRVRLARASERYSLARMEDPAGGLELVSILVAREGRWTVHFHERVFDYFAFGLPLDPSRAFDSPTREAQKVLALSEFMLRHQFERIVWPERDVMEVLESDCRYVVECRESEPALYSALTEALDDDLNGLRTADFVELIRRYEDGEGFSEHAEGMIRDHVPELTKLPESTLTGVFHALSGREKGLLLDACHRQTRDGSLTLARRALQLENLVALFDHQRREDVDELRRLFEGFADRWPVEEFLREIDVQPSVVDSGQPDAPFERLVSALETRGRVGLADEVDEAPPPVPEPQLDSATLSNERPTPTGTLRDRIEAARLDPTVPRSVLRAIDNNFENIDGHSKAKYTEFIETLLAMPWGHIRPIEVGPREFAAGLEESHFGLAAAKELVSDFFANLIWRYRSFQDTDAADWHRTGSAFLFVGPPGVGKTSLAISIARNLGIPFHKVSLGGMRDESALRGHGFTYEGSKPGAVVQGLIKMAAMNGMFIFDEADKTEPLAIATLLEILDPEQNHLFHDKYTQTTVDIDLSNCHFILTANTLDTVPEPVVDRCQVVHLGRYSVEEKVEIARRHILPRLRRVHDIAEDVIDFEPDRVAEDLRFLVHNYTHEAGVRQLELVLRTLLLRLQRRSVFENDAERVVITRQLIKRSLEEPGRPASINSEDRVGEVMALGVNAERGVGGVIPVQATRVPSTRDGNGSAVSMVHATGNLEKVMDESRRVATTAILHCADRLDLDPTEIDAPIHLHFMGGSTRKDGPSAGAAIGLAVASLLTGHEIRRDVAVTGEIDTQGRITGVGGLDVKLETAINAGCKTLIIPNDNLSGPGGIERLPEAVRRELLVMDFESWTAGREAYDHQRHLLQVVSVAHIAEAFEIARVDRADLDALTAECIDHARDHRPSLRAEQMCPLIMMVKDSGEIDDGQFNERLCPSCSGCQVLIPESSDSPPIEVPGAPEATSLSRIEAGPESLRRAVNEAAADNNAGVAEIVVVAPYFALLEAGISAVETPRTVRAFANNYECHGLKLKGAKPWVHRVVCRLSHLGPRALESFPLLTRQDGIWMADLGAVPEKYRLDPGRCEEILTGCMRAWLDVMDNGAPVVH